MKKYLLLVLLLLQAIWADTQAGGKYLITASAIGPIKLGVTLGEAKKAFPKAVFERSSDAEGVPFVDVVLGKETLMSIYAGENNADAPIDWSKKIVSIETFSPLCSTASGIRVGSSVLDVEKILGKVREIQKSEIESREYVFFDKQPKSFTFRLDYTGIFKKNKTTTTEFDPKAKIYSIMIELPPYWWTTDTTAETMGDTLRLGAK